MWINALIMGHLPCLLFTHLGITGKLSFTVAVEGFWSREERREEGLSLAACFASPSTDAEAHLWAERNCPNSSQAPGKPRPLLCGTKFDFVFLTSSVRMWLWKFQARLKSWWCARDKTWEKSPQKKNLFQIHILTSGSCLFELTDINHYSSKIAFFHRGNKPCVFD